MTIPGEPDLPSTIPSSISSHSHTTTATTPQSMPALSKATRTLPTHSQLTEFISTILPPHPRDISLIYHSPRHPHYNAATTPVLDVVLSITPTPGVYTKLTNLASSNRPMRPVCFLHRPFNLDRKAVPRGSLVVASHKRFDELLTTGWNVALADRLGLDIESARCLQGYKLDPERRIGLVARLNTSCSLGDVCDSVRGEFGVGDVVPLDVGIDRHDDRIDAVAIMNAFGADEVVRAVVCATEAGFIAEGDHARLLYLTGESKELGLAKLRETYAGMAALCVGHRPAEEWGVSYLSTCIKKRWEDLHVHLVFEDEEPPPPREPREGQRGGTKKASSNAPLEQHQET